LGYTEWQGPQRSLIEPYHQTRQRRKRCEGANNRMTIE
jgi:hypothetical protein